MRDQGYTQSIIVFSFSFLMLVLVFYSLHFGITPRDEPFYLSMPYRFILGDRPFIDEWNLLQTASLFILPFIKLYLYFKGSTEGIIIFIRYMHFASTILLASLVYFAFKKITNNKTALLLSLPCIVFVPYNLHSLSYNTLTMLFLAAGYFFGLLAVIEFQSYPCQRKGILQINRSDLFIFFAGICHVSAVICYPPMFIIPIIFIFCLIYFLPRLRTILIYSTAIFIGGIWFLNILINAGLDHLLIIYDFAKNIRSTTSLGILGYFPLVFNKHREFFLYVIPLSCFLIGVSTIISIKKFNISISKISFLFIIALLIVSLKMNAYGNGAVLLLSGVIAFAILLFFLLRNFESLYVKHLFILIGIPSLIAGIIPCMLSSCSIIASVIGTFPCALISLYYMTLNEEHGLTNQKFSTLPMISLLIFLVFLGSLQYFNLKHPYEESASPLQLHYKFKNGPFKDIYTTKEVYLYYTQLAKDINQVYKRDHRILFFDNFPAGYLFSDMRPATNAIWTLSASFSMLNRHAMVNYLKAHHLKPDIIVKIHSVPLSDIYLKYKNDLFKYEIDDPVNQLTQNYQLILRREGYEIYQIK